MKNLNCPPASGNEEPVQVLEIRPDLRPLRCSKKTYVSSSKAESTPTPPGMTTNTLGTLIDDFLNDYATLVRDGERSPRTLRNYRGFAKNWLAPLRSWPLEDLAAPQAPANLRRWAANVALEASFKRHARGGTATANVAIYLLDTILKWAESDGVLPRGAAPTRYVRRYSTRRRERFLDDAELRQLLRALAQVERQRVRAAPSQRQAGTYSITEAIRLLVLTGMRREEALLLRWEDVRLDARRIILPRSKTGLREIPLSAESVALLRRQRQRHPRSEWCFPTWRAPYGPVRQILNVWRQAIDLSGIDPRGVVPHTLRHSLATGALRRGRKVRDVSLVLGHSTTSITERVYGRPLATPGAFEVVEEHARRIRAA